MLDASQRKLDHIHLSLQNANQAFHRPPFNAKPSSPQRHATKDGQLKVAREKATGLDHIHLQHEALPELDFNTLHLRHSFCGFDQQKPLLISCMTGGVSQGEQINFQLAEVAQQQGWLMGIGSQRHELEALQASFKNQSHTTTKTSPSQQLRQSFKSLRFLANIGITQLIQYGPQAIRPLVENLEACALVVHTNPLQECLQVEGTPQFSGSRRALEQLCGLSPVPVILKETGCGFEASTLNSLKGLGLKAVDISGYGGTHWGRIEGARAQQPLQQKAAETFAHWGAPTAQVLQKASPLQLDYELWASGGLRTGLDAAKCFALGAECAGFAQPVLKALLQGGPSALESWMQQIEFELKVALFCTGSPDIKSLKGRCKIKDER